MPEKGRYSSWMGFAAVMTLSATACLNAGCAAMTTQNGEPEGASRSPDSGHEAAPAAASGPTIVPPATEGAIPDSVDPLKKILLILPFRDESKYKGPWDIYGQIPRGLADSLAGHPAFHVITPDSGFSRLSEKERIGKIKKTRAVAIGRELGADVVVLGEIEQITISRLRAVVPLGGYRSYSGNTTVTAYFYNTIDAQEVGEYRSESIIDTKRTGIVNPAQHVPLDREYYFMGEAAWGSEEFHKTLVGQSVGQCLQQLAAGLETVIRPAPELMTSEPKIIDIDGSRAYINVGLADAIQNGDKFGVWDQGRELRDPETDAVLGFALPRRVGVIQVVQVLNVHLSQVRIIEGQDSIETSFTLRAE